MKQPTSEAELWDQDVTRVILETCNCIIHISFSVCLVFGYLSLEPISHMTRTLEELLAIVNFTESIHFESDPWFFYMLSG